MWLDEVQRHVRRGLGRAGAWPPPEEVFPDALYRKTVEDSVEEAVARARLAPPVEAFEWVQPPRPEEVHTRLVNEWLVSPAGRNYVDRVYWHLMDRLSPPAETAREILTRVCRIRMGLPDDGDTSTAWLEASATANACWDSRSSPNHQDPLLYAHELRLMRSGCATQVGRVLSRLGGRDAVCWLLTLEILQSIGPGDPWRLSRETVGYLLLNPDQAVRWQDLDPHESEEVDFPHSWKTIHRLERLGLIWIDPSEFRSAYRLRSSGIEILRDLLSPQLPMRGIAGALLERDSSQMVTDEQFRAGSERRAVEWVIETMAHGLRNSLGPVSFVLEQMRESSGLAPETAEGFERVRIGVGRAFKLVNDLVALYRASDTPPVDFDLETAIADAIFESNGSGVESQPSEPVPIVLRGHRLRLVHALVELIRNARRHARPNTPIQVIISSARQGRDVLLTIDDNGTGVPAPLRTRIFEPGFSTRPEGTGQGLALLRDVIEADYRGRIEVTDSPLGGARFILWLAQNGGNGAC